MFLVKCFTVMARIVFERKSLTEACFTLSLCRFVNFSGISRFTLSWAIFLEVSENCVISPAALKKKLDLDYENNFWRKIPRVSRSTPVDLWACWGMMSERMDEWSGAVKELRHCLHTLVVPIAARLPCQPPHRSAAAQPCLPATLPGLGWDTQHRLGGSGATSRDLKLVIQRTGSVSL